jgi:hypothetical protein
MYHPKPKQVQFSDGHCTDFVSKGQKCELLHSTHNVESPEEGRLIDKTRQNVVRLKFRMFKISRFLFQTIN